MRIEMLGHACLLCETDDARILMDPWLVGPANFRSWWHIPAVTRSPTELPPLDYLYISHQHGDHFHDPTLEQLDRRATVLVPRLYHKRMLRRLRDLGYTRIVELPHAKEVRLTRATRVTCVQMGRDSVLAVADSSASMLNANDALQGAHPDIKLPLLGALATRYRFDIVFLAFGTAGPFPKCYRIEDVPARAMDPWLKERAMLRNFLEGARTIRAKTVVPFAGGFALLADKLLWMNEAKTTPADALGLLREREPEITGLEMNPGDIWDSRAGLIRVHAPVAWDRRLEIIDQLRQAHASELSVIDTEDRQGPADLQHLFQSRLAQNLRRFPLLRRRMNSSILVVVEGEPGGAWEVDLRRASNWFREGDSGDWVIRLTIPSGLLAQVLTDPDGLETLAISYKLDLYVKAGARPKEALLDRLLYTPSPTWLLKTLFAPRFAEFVILRRKEFWQTLRAKLTAAG
jgi:hypothetical protein